MIRSSKLTTCGVFFLIVLTIRWTRVAAAENLGDILRESKWDRIIGDWVDADTHGAKLQVTYSWRFEDRVVEITTNDGDKETVALIGRNAKTGEVYNVSADNQGGGSLGKWKLDGGDALLELGYITGKGEEGGLKIRHRLEDNNTLIVTLELSEPVTFKLIRVKK